MSNIDPFKCQWCNKTYTYKANIDKHINGCKSNPANKVKKQKTESDINQPLVQNTINKHSIERLDMVQDGSDIGGEGNISPDLVNILNRMQENILEFSKKQAVIIASINNLDNDIKQIRNRNEKNLLTIKNMTKSQVEDHQKLLDVDQNLKNLTEKFEKFKDNAITSTTGYCQICWDNPSNYAFTPCGHKTVCGTCAAQVMSSHQKCMLCRERVYDIIQIWDGGQKEI